MTHDRYRMTIRDDATGAVVASGVISSDAEHIHVTVDRATGKVTAEAMRAVTWGDVAGDGEPPPRMWVDVEGGGA